MWKEGDLHEEVVEVQHKELVVRADHCVCVPT